MLVLSEVFHINIIGLTYSSNCFGIPVYLLDKLRYFEHISVIILLYTNFMTLIL